MGRADIESWIASTTPSADERDEDIESAANYWKEARDDWPAFLQRAQHALLSSSTKERIAFLGEQLEPLAKDTVSQKEALELFKLLTLTYPRYHDARSRESVEEVIKLLCSIKPEVTEQIMKWVRLEVTRISGVGFSAATSKFVILSWICEIYSVALIAFPNFTSHSSWTDLIDALALVFSSLMDENSASRKGIKKSSLAKVLRALKKSTHTVPSVQSALLKLLKDKQGALYLFPLLGASYDVLLSTRHDQIDRTLQEEITRAYVSYVLLSKVQVSSHVSEALIGFISTSVDSSSFEVTILPSMEKASLRSPEISLPVMRDFFTSFKPQLSETAVRRVLTIVLNSSKSANPTTRDNSVKVFEVVAEKNKEDKTTAQLCIEELTAPLKAGKTNGVDHRQVLYRLLMSISSSPYTSKLVVGDASTIMSKETNENAFSVLTSALAPHAAETVKDGKTLPKDLLTILVRDMNSAKPAIRRAVYSLVGYVFWVCSNCSTVPADSLKDFFDSILPSLESSLKAVSCNPLTVPAGPLEGYIALVIILRFDASVGGGLFSTKYSSVLAPSNSKPPFFLWDKVYQKCDSLEDELWLLRLLQVALQSQSINFGKHGELKVLFGQAFIHLVAHSRNLEIRRDSITALRSLNKTFPELVNDIVRESLLAYLEHNSHSHKYSTDDQNAARISGRLFPLLLACANFDQSTDIELKERLITRLLIVSHHPVISGPSGQSWIDLCQLAAVDPQQLVEKHKKLIIDQLKNALQNATLEVGARHAATTALFVDPQDFLPSLFEQLRQDLGSSDIKALTEQEIEIWKTPEGTLYNDVLSAKQSKQVARKGKDADLEKWEREVRQSLASKKTNAATQKGHPQALSKQDKELIDAELRKESDVRRRVEQVRRVALRGLALSQCIVDAKVQESSAFFAELIDLFLGGPVKYCATLLGNDLFKAYSALSSACSDRLGSFRYWIGISTLRAYREDLVPTEMKEEQLYSLFLRVLHRLRSASEQAPFDAQTFSYFSPMLTHVIVEGGIEGGEEEEKLEQIALALNIIAFHAGEFATPGYPRGQAMRNLLNIAKRFPSLGKDTTSALLTISEAIRFDATPSDVKILTNALLSQEVNVRNASLQSLQALDLTELEWSSEIWITCNDSDQQNARIADRLWEDNGLDVPEDFLKRLIPFLEHEYSCIRISCALSLDEATAQWPAQISKIVLSLQDLYHKKASVTGPQYDEYGILITRSADESDPWPIRIAIATAFGAVAPYFEESLIEPFFKFLLDESALGDRHADVRREMLSAAARVIDLHGTKRLPGLISTFEKQLSVNSSSESADYVKEASVVLLGRVARHLNASDERLPGVVDRLVEALKIPSEQVQVAVSDCLPPLVRLIKDSTSSLVEKLFGMLFNGAKYGERRGAAYGLAGVLRGTGLVGFKEYDVLPRLKDAMEDKKSADPRQGAMFALETLSAALGRTFEPYIIELLPSLLASFGDSSPDVREAAEDAAKVIMANLSGYGVKRILPSLLSGLEEKQWRTKKGAIELLGSMAFCAPKQLSISLPTVIPQLTGVLTDSHAQVRGAANRSLKQFGEVINNPEIHSMVPVLLKALVDPVKTPTALGSLLKTSFVHYIDSPSLALVIPIIVRGLRERGSETKRKAVQIVGNLASLTDSQDFVPYLTTLLPLVNFVLVDPVPEARATAAKALGTLIERLGEDQFPDMVPSLLRTLKTEASTVDKLGAAQGLSEVLAGLGMERLEALLPDIVSNAQSTRSNVREGFMSLLVFLPATFGARFQPHLSKIIGPILSGLSDSEEKVREEALKAGRMIIVNYSNKAIDLLLPELERGMFDASWRIRVSSVQLVGELLFKISGISGKAESGDDVEEEVENTAAEPSRKALGDALGRDRRDRVLSSLYIIRQDPVANVRSTAGNIWKALVNNTPRTVRELLPELIKQLLVLLVNEDDEAFETASKTIGELCRKFGERILGEIIPILRTNSSSADNKTREGVCLALCEIMQSATETQRETYDDDITSIVRTSLVDEAANVRTAAARAFDGLQEHLGKEAIDKTIPTLLEALRQPGESSGTALQALKEVMTVRANSVFPILVPTLLSRPISIFNAHALASLMTVAGSALTRHLQQILEALISSLESNDDSELEDALNEAVSSLLSSIRSTDGMDQLLRKLADWVQTGSPIRRAHACRVFAEFCDVNELDDSSYRTDWIRYLISLHDDQEEVVYAAASKALDAFVKSVPKDELESLVVQMRRTIESTGSPGHSVPGFNIPKGISPMVPVIIAGLTTGSNEQRENAAYAIGDLVIRTEEAAFKPYVIQFTGPLIRVATQSATYPPGVKSAILSALTTLLERVPTLVKPFFPQLQRTFVKSTSDPTSAAVRNRAASALGVLMRLQPRVDPVVTELVTGVRASDEEIAASYVKALAEVVDSAGTNLGEKSREACVELVSDAFKETHDDHYIRATASLFAALSSKDELLRPIINSHLLAGTPPTALSSHAILAVLSQEDGEEASKKDVDNIFQRLSVIPSIRQKINESVVADRSSIARPAREAKELIVSLYGN